jgi:Zn-dependent protease
MTVMRANAIRVEVQANCVWPLSLLTLMTMYLFGVTPGLLAGTMFVGCLLIHEVGHATAARAYGVPISAIGLCSKGSYILRAKSAGVAEVMIAAAGPCVNLTVAALLWVFAPHTALLDFLFLVNAVLGLSNLLPIRGADGARILAAALPSRRA